MQPSPPALLLPFPSYPFSALIRGSRRIPGSFCQPRIAAIFKVKTANLVGILEGRTTIGGERREERTTGSSSR